MPKRKVADVFAESHEPSRRILRNTAAATSHGALTTVRSPPPSTADVAAASTGINVSDDEVDLDALLDAATEALAAREPSTEAAAPSHIKQLMTATNGVVKLAPDVLHAETAKLTAAQAAQKAKEKGTDWFEMQTPELTDTLKRDLQILRMRSVLDPKRHYRKENTRTVGADAKKLAGPRFEMGTLMADATESAAHKTRRKDQKQTIVAELLADTDRRAYLKRKQAEIDQQKRSGGKKFYKGVKDRRGSRFSRAAN